VLLQLATDIACYIETKVALKIVREGCVSSHFCSRRNVLEKLIERL